jgi:hypothetical protein
LKGSRGRLTAYLIPSLLLRRVSFLRFRSWKPAWISLMNLLIWRGREKSPSVTALGARRAWGERRRVSLGLHKSGEMVGPRSVRVAIQPGEHLEEASRQHEQETRGDVRKCTSSSIVVVSANRYSSMVRWKISRSLTLIGTVMIQSAISHGFLVRK